MDFVYTFLDMLAAAVRAVWPGVLGAAAGGYLGWSMFGFAGYLIGAAIGAMAGTWAGDRLGLLKVRKLTGITTTDQLVYAGGAFATVVVVYFLWQFMVLIGAIVAVAALALFWVSS